MVDIMNEFDMSAKELLERAEELRRNCMFGEAINFYRAAAQPPDASDEIKRKSLASVELMQEINGFVNTDLMNPEGRCLLYLESESCRDGRDEAEQTSVVKAGFSSVSDTCRPSDHFVASVCMEAEIWSYIQRQLKWKPECVLYTGLCYH